MSKRARVKTATGSPGASRAAGDVGPREPCPCGSGRRYKACHGRADGRMPFVVRTFEGLACECDLVAMREFVPAATAPLPLPVSTDRAVLLCTSLPGALPAMVRDDGTVWLGAQVQHNSGDVSRDMAHALELALAAEPGSSIGMTDLPAAGSRLQDLLDATRPIDVTVHDGFDFWVADVPDETGEVAAALEQANAAAAPTKRLDSVEAAYWTSAGSKEHLRWVMPQPEEQLLDALARLHTEGADALGDESRLVGSFRAHGVLVPVWDLPIGTGADALESPVADFARRLTSALDNSSQLSTDQRAARAGLANRQLTIR
jgi:Family of unknown function (DUF5926)/SEC-C motif